MLSFKFIQLFLVLLLLSQKVCQSKFGLFNLTLKENPQIKAVARQRFLDFVTDIGVDEFVAHQQDIQVDHVATQDYVPLLGNVDVDLDNITGRDIVLPKEMLRLALISTGFQLECGGISSTFDFLWRWHKGILGGHGDGSLSLLDGHMEVQFAIDQGDDGTFTYKTIAADTQYNDVQLTLRANRLNWLYQIILKVFKRQIKSKIESKIVDFLKNELPDVINKKLAKIPQQIEIAGLPFKNRLIYSVYSSKFIMFQGFEQIQFQGPQQKRIHGKTRPTDESNNEINISQALSQQLAAIKKIIQQQSEECQYQANPLDLTPTEIENSDFMFSGYLHQSFFKCAGWALFNENKLKKTIRDGDIKGLHLITDLFIVLIPGVEIDYPGHSMEINAVATSVPEMKLLDDSRVFVSSESVQTFYVIQPAMEARLKQRDLKMWDQQSIAFQDDEETNEKLIQVAKMSVKLNVTAQMSYNQTKIETVEVQHQVLESQYNIDPKRWDYTVKYALTMYGNKLTIESIADKYLNLNIKQLNISVINTQAHFFEEWAKIEGDLHINSVDSVQ